MRCNLFYYFLLAVIVNTDGISTNFNQREITEEERRAADVLDKATVLPSFYHDIAQEKGRKFALATTYHKEGQLLVPRLAASFKPKEEEAKESEHNAQKINYYGDHKQYPSPSASRIGFPGLFSPGMPYQDRGVMYGHSGYGHSNYGQSNFGHSGPSSYGHSGGGYYYPSHQMSNFDHSSIFKKIGLKGLLIPIAGIALLGAAAALTANPLLLQLGTLNGKRRRRSVQPHIPNSSIYPTNPYIKPTSKK